VDETNKFEISQGRHPIVEKSLKSSFIPNDCNLEKRLWLVTGPNMGGKSTFLRQNAILVLLAQIGSFVPASSAHIGTVDRLFSRIGAGDDISKGYSTFFMEMSETAQILSNVTSKSFVILDELGRGTSTQDGLAIARAVIENLHEEVKCRTLFATHYHELTELDKLLSNLHCATVKVKEWEGKILFMHEVIAGKAEKSYGINVAELAGIPKNVTDRAFELLGQSPEFPTPDVPTRSAANSNEQRLINKIQDIEIDGLTPIEAFALIYELKKLINQ
jgi:DNA mismatch repair protein MutS